VTLDNGEQRQVLVPPDYPLEAHTNSPVPVGTATGSGRPKIQISQLVEGIWLAKVMA
jgi:hypothetical protein